MGHRNVRILCAAIAPAIAAALVSAPTADATCASFFGFGFGSGGDCTSSPTSVAIAIGANAAAHAHGFFGGALAAGDNSYAGIQAGSWFNIATAFGYSAGAAAGHVLSLGVAIGLHSVATAGTSSSSNPRVGNIAIVFAPNEVGAHASADGVASVGVNLFSGNTIVYAGQGPLAIAASIGQKNATVTKSGPGINVNGVSLGGKKTAAVHAKGTATGAKSGTGRSARQ